MSSNLNSATGRRSRAKSGRIGWASGIRLGLYYALFFTLVSAGLFAVAYSGVARAIHQRELDIVRNRAREYRAWYLNGEIDMLEARMDEQSLESGDVMFVRITGPGLEYVKYYAPDGGKLPPRAAVEFLDPSTEGHDIELGGERWAVASIELAEEGRVLLAGKNARAGEATLAEMRGEVVWTLLPAMIAAAVGGTLLTYRALSPIRRLIVAMREILQSGNLSWRADPERGRNELNALVELFNRLLARNESLIEAMHHSLDNVAHDFRTPLSRFKNTAERALEAGDDPEQLRDALADCVEESEELAKLLAILMEVSEAEAGTMELNLEQFSLPDLVEGVVQLYEFVAEEKGIVVETDLPQQLVVRGDRMRLSQAVANLLDNAIKYSPKGGTVGISVSEEGGRAVVTVHDQGSGISETDLPHIWDRLFRAELSRTTPGMGLGLSFVKAITAAHGGCATITSYGKEGATFRIEIPGSQSF